MAKERASILIHALDDAHVDLTPIRDRREPVEAPRELPPPFDRVRDVPAVDPGKSFRNFMYVPLGDAQPDAASTMLSGFESLRPVAKRERMVPYPIRLPTSQIAELESLREERGIIPAEFIRDAVASCLTLLRRS